MNLDKIKIKNCRGVYQPREDSYLLSKAVNEQAFGKVLDLGTGSGIQGIIAAMDGCEVTFADKDQKAIDCAKANAILNEINGKFVVSDLFSNIKGKFNTIIFNPPYLESDRIKDIDLDGGIEGRELIDKFINNYKSYVLKEHKVLLIESSINSYMKDVKRLKAKIIGKDHFFFEELVVLLFE